MYFHTALEIHLGILDYYGFMLDHYVKTITYLLSGLCLSLFSIIFFFQPYKDIKNKIIPQLKYVFF